LVEASWKVLFRHTFVSHDMPSVGCVRAVSGEIKRVPLVPDLQRVCEGHDPSTVNVARHVI
jgi:hypothetical protein